MRESDRLWKEFCARLNQEATRQRAGAPDTLPDWEIEEWSAPMLSQETRCMVVEFLKTIRQH